MPHQKKILVHRLFMSLFLLCLSLNLFRSLSFMEQSAIKIRSPFSSLSLFISREREREGRGEERKEREERGEKRREREES